MKYRLLVGFLLWAGCAFGQMSFFGPNPTNFASAGQGVAATNGQDIAKNALAASSNAFVLAQAANGTGATHTAQIGALSQTQEVTTASIAGIASTQAQVVAGLSGLSNGVAGRETLSSALARPKAFDSAYLGGSAGTGAIPTGSVRTVLNQSASAWMAYPRMGRLADGRLLAVYSVGLSDFDSTSTLYYQLSADGGLSWSSACYLYRSPDPTEGTGVNGLTVMNDGTIVLALREQTSSGSRMEIMSGTVSASWGIVWSAPQDVTPTGAVAQAWCQPGGSVLMLDSGAWVLPFFEAGYANGYYFGSTYVMVSSNSGATWGPPILVADSGSTLEYEENDMLKLPNGDVICVIRRQDGDTGGNAQYVLSRSTNNCLSWSSPTNIITPGSSIGHPTLVRLSSGAIVMIAGGTGTGGRLRDSYQWVSWDNGTNWSASPFNYSAAASSGYDNYWSLVKLSGGHIGSVAGFAGGLDHAYIQYQDWREGYGAFAGGVVRASQMELGSSIWRIVEWNGSNCVAITIGSDTTYIPVGAVPPSGPVAWYKFESGSFTVDSAGSHTLTQAGSPTAATGCPAGGGVVLNGTTDYFYTGSHSDLPKGDLTVAAWVKTSHNTTTQPVLEARSFDPDYPAMFYLLGQDNGLFDAVPQGEVYKQSVYDYYARAGGAALNDGNWHHVAFVRNGSSCYVFVDGIDGTTVSSGGSGVTGQTSYPVYIGVTSDMTSRFLHGSIGDVRLYARALSGTEINALANP